MKLGCLWFGSVKPAMCTFLKPFVEAMNLLKNGIECFSPAMGNFICKGYLGLVARKPVFRVSHKASFKPVSSATETS